MWNNHVVVCYVKSKESPKSGNFLCIHASAADAVDGIKTLLSNGLRTFFINAKNVFSIGPISLSKNPPNWIILDSWVLDDFVLADELFPKAL